MDRLRNKMIMLEVEYKSYRNWHCNKETCSNTTCASRNKKINSIKKDLDEAERSYRQILFKFRTLKKNNTDKNGFIGKYNLHTEH